LSRSYPRRRGFKTISRPQSTHYPMHEAGGYGSTAIRIPATMQHHGIVRERLGLGD
jgi:hypothetical protein